jgi:hypothetical protein
MVRARLRGYLEALKEQFSDLLGPCEVQEFAGTDYTYRIFVAKSVWSQFLAGLGEETDYDNFEAEVARHQGKAGGAYERFPARRVVGNEQAGMITSECRRTRGRA